MFLSDDNLEDTVLAAGVVKPATCETYLPEVEVSF